MTQNQGLLDPAGLGPLPPIFLPQCSPLIAGQTFDFGSTPGQCVDPLGYFDSDNDLFAGDYDFEPKQEDDFVGGSITLNWDINDEYALTSITGVESYERFVQEDLDSSPFPVIHLNFQDDIDQFTQELRLDYVSDDVNWVAGLYFAEDEVNSRNDDACLDDNPGATVPFCVLSEYQQVLSQDKWTPLIGQRGSEFKGESDIVIMLPVRAVRCPHKPHSVSDRSDWSEAARDYNSRSRC